MNTKERYGESARELRGLFGVSGYFVICAPWTMKFVVANCSIGYPVYGAKFLNNHMLLVAGGGGEGNNGIPNKLTVLRVDFSKKKIIKRFREITLDSNDDSPTTLDVANDIILMGCNESSAKIKNGDGNHHLRKFVFENEHLKYIAGIDFDRSTQPEDYTKLIYLSRDGSVGAIASSAIPTVIRIIDPKELTEKYEIETGHEVKDMHFAPDGKVISYITASTLEVISIVTGRFIIRKTDFDPNYALSKIKFLTDDIVFIAASLKKGTGIVMIKISLRSGNATVLKTKLITNKFKGVTAMDVDMGNELAVLAGSDNSLALVKLKDLSLGRIFKQVHSFAITRVSFSPDSNLIASVSAANTVHVIKVPENFAHSTSIWSKLWKMLLNFAFIALIAFFAQLSIKYDLHNKAIIFAKNYYEERRNRTVAKREDSEQVTLVGAVSNDPSTSSPTSMYVTPTYSLSSSSIVSTGNPYETAKTTTKLLSEGDSQYQSFAGAPTEVYDMSHEEPTSSTSNGMGDTTHHFFGEQDHQLKDYAETDATLSGTIDESPTAYTEKPNAGSISSLTTQTVGIPSAKIQVVAKKNWVADDKIVEASLSSLTAFASSSRRFAEITDTTVAHSVKTAINSLSHYGATPKPSDSDQVSGVTKGADISEDTLSGEIPTSFNAFVETAPNSGTNMDTSVGISSPTSIHSTALKRTDFSDVTKESSPASTALTPITSNFVGLDEGNHGATAETPTTTEGISDLLTDSVPTTEVQSSAPGKVESHPMSHSDNEHRISTTIAATKIEPTPETIKEAASKVSGLSSASPDLPSEQVSSVEKLSSYGGIYPDEVPVEVASATIVKSGRAISAQPKSSADIGIDVSADDSASLTTSSSTTTEIPATTKEAQGSISELLSEFVDVNDKVFSATQTSSKVSGSGHPMVSQTTNSTTPDTSSGIVAITALSNTIPPSEASIRLESLSSSSEPLILDSPQVSPAKLSKSTTQEVSTAVATESKTLHDEMTRVTSLQSSTSRTSPVSRTIDDSSLVASHSKTRESMKTTPTSDQISDSSHLEELVPEYAQSLDTGVKKPHTHQAPSHTSIPTIEENEISISASSTGFPISSSQNAAEIVEDSSSAIAEQTFGESSKPMSPENPTDGIEELLDEGPEAQVI